MEKIREVEDRIKELKEEIAYEKEKIKCCAYGKREILYLAELEEELARLESDLDEIGLDI